MRSYGQYCPIALGAEVFAERWTPIILRNLHLGCRRYAEILDGAPGLPRNVLSTRLRTLRRHGVVAQVGTGRQTRYELTDCGRELFAVCNALGAWGARWMEVRPEDQDPYLALWTISRCVDADSLLPRPRVVVRFDITDRGRPNRYWLVVGQTGNEVCVEPPGFADDGVVTSDTSSLIRWYAGHLTLGAAQRAGGLSVAAPRWLERELVKWGRFNPHAHVTRPRR